MKLKQIQEILEAQIIVADDSMDMEVPRACGCDLMSDVANTVIHMRHGNQIVDLGLQSKNLALKI